MTLASSKPLQAVFHSVTQDWSDEAIADRVLYLPRSTDAEFTKLCKTVLSHEESWQADRFITDDDRSQFIQRRAFRKYCAALAGRSDVELSTITFDETENGAPWLANQPDIRFSFSSCRSGFVGAWSRTRAVGIDIQDLSTEVEAAELAVSFFTAAEARIVRKDVPLIKQRFLQLWCLKEAALKSIGEGLPFGLDSFEFEIDEGFRMVRVPPLYKDPTQFKSQLFERAGAYLAVVTMKVQTAM